HGRNLARAGGEGEGLRDRRPHPGPPRRPRQARLRPAQAPADGAAGRRRGLAARGARRAQQAGRLRSPQRMKRTVAVFAAVSFSVPVSGGVPSGFDSPNTSPEESSTATALIRGLNILASGNGSNFVGGAAGHS